MKLIFVYNANSGKLNALFDVAHKLVSPSTYQCDLCDLTFGVFSEKSEWLRFREREKTTMQFLHKDEFVERYNSKWLPKYDYPIILVEKNQNLEVAVTKEDFENIKTSKELINEVKKVIALYKT